MLEQGRWALSLLLPIILTLYAFSNQPCCSQKDVEGAEAQVAAIVRSARNHLRARDTVNTVAMLERARKQFPDALSVRYLLSAAYFCRAVALEDKLGRPDRDLRIGTALANAVQRFSLSESSRSQYEAALRDYMASVRLSVSKWSEGIERRERLFSAAEREARQILARVDDADTKILLAWLNAYRALAATDWARKRESLLRGVESYGRPLTLQEQRWVILLNAQKENDLQEQAVRLFLQVLRQKPNDPAVYASFADCLVLLSGAKGTSRRVLSSLPVMDTSKISPSAPTSPISINLDELSEEQVVSSPEAYVPLFYERAIAMDSERRLPSARYGLLTTLISVGTMDFAQAEKMLNSLQASDPQNALYKIDRALLMWGRDRTQAAELLRSAARSTAFRRELLTTAPVELITTLGASQQVNDLLGYRVGAPYVRLFSEINKGIAQAQSPRERIRQLFFKVELAERFMQSHYLFDYLLGTQEKKEALHQLLALAPYLNPVESSVLRSRIFNFERATDGVKPLRQAWVLDGGRVWRGPARDADAIMRGGSEIVAFYDNGRITIIRTIRNKR